MPPTGIRRRTDSPPTVWDKASAEAEIAQGKAIANASLAAGVSLMIWSSLPNVTKMSNGQLTTVEHFDSKAEVEDYIRSLKFRSSVFFLPGWFMQNFWDNLVPKPRMVCRHPFQINSNLISCSPANSIQISEDTVLFPFAWPPDMRIPLIDIGDAGRYLAPALRDPAKYDGVQLVSATAFYSAQDIVDIWSRVSGKNVRLATGDEIDQFITHPLQRDVLRPGLLFLRYGYFGPNGDRDLDWTLAQLDPADKLTTWEDFLVRNGPCDFK